MLGLGFVASLVTILLIHSYGEFEIFLLRDSYVKGMRKGIKAYIRNFN